MNKACVIGNGPSRKQFSLETIGRQMTTYGCNALYRDYMPNYLICMDRQMVDEVLKNEVQYKTKFYTPETHNFDHMTIDSSQCINWLKNMAKRLDSGNNALELALDNKHDIIYIIGFDYNSSSHSLPNLYHGTKNYAPNMANVHAEELAYDWQQRLRMLVKEYPDTQIIRVNGSNTPMTTDATNYSEITSEQFKEIYERTN